MLTFEDGTKAVVSSNDITLGGIVNTLDIFTTNTVLHCDMAANDALKAYTPSPDSYGDEYISEKIETKAGWTFPSPDEDWMRGYPQEMQDFAQAILEDREPVSNGEPGTAGGKSYLCGVYKRPNRQACRAERALKIHSKQKGDCTNERHDESSV